MTCARYRALISRYLDDELTPRQRAELLDHVKHCASCAADLARYRQAEVLLRKIPEGEPAPKLKPAVLREARRRRRRERHSLIWLLSAGGRANPRMVACVLAIGLLLPVLAGVLLPVASGQAIGARFGFSAPATPTSAYLDVPESPTPAPPGPLSPPHLVATKPYDGAEGVDPRTSLVVSFDQAMDRRSVERAFRLSPPVPGEFTWEADNQVRFQPKAPGLLQGVSYSVALTDGARSLAGAALSPSTVWAFHTQPGPALDAVVPAPGAIGITPTATLVLTFTQPMDTGSVAFTLARRPAPAAVLAANRAEAPAPAAAWTPTGSADWSADRRVLRFTPTAPLPPGELQVTLQPGARTGNGNNLAPTAWSFTVAGDGSGVVLAGTHLLMLNATVAEIGYSTNVDQSDAGARAVQFALYPAGRAMLESRIPWLLGTAGSGPWPPLQTGASPPVKTWTAPLPRSLEQQAGRSLTTTIPLHEPGLYLLTADSGDGPADQRLVALSDEALLLFKSNGLWRAWVSNPLTGAGVDGAQVRLYDQAGAVLASGATDNHGLAALVLPADAHPALVVAEHNGNLTIAQPDPAVIAQAAMQSADNLDVTVIRDRDRYTPGATVLFSALVRPPKTTPAATAITVRLLDPAGRELDALSLQPDPHGALHGAFPLAAGVAPGTYYLAFALSDRVFHEPVPVDPLTPTSDPAAMQLNLQVAEPALYAGELLTATLQTSYGPARMAPEVPVSLSLVPLGDSTPTLVLTATTGTDGQALVPLRLPVPDSGQGATPSGYRLEANATDSRGRSATAATLLEVRAGRLSMEQTVPTRAFAPDSSTVITITLRDEAGHPLAGRVVNSGLADAGLAATSDPAQTSSLLNTVTAVTDGRGVATATVSLPLQGAFSLRSVVTDSAGIPVSAATRVWVYEQASHVSAVVPWLPATEALLTPDQESYRPGEIAHLLIQAPGAGGGLLVTRLRDQIVDMQSVTFTTGGGVVAVTVPADMRTGDPLVVEFLRFATNDSGPYIVSRRLPLPVQPNQEPRLDLTVPTPPPSGAYAPSSTLPVQLTLTDEGINPAAAEVLLRLSALGDEAAPLAASPPTANWPAGDGGAPVIQASTEAPVFWNAGLSLDSSGQLSTTVRLPAEAGIWNLDAWALTPNGVNHSQVLVRTLPPLAVQWAMPESLVQGDSTTAVATITNNQETAANVSLHLQMGGDHALDLTSPQEQNFRLAPGETRTATWTMRAPAPGTVQVSLDAAWGAPGAPGLTVHRNQAIIVAPYGIVDEQTHAGTVGDSESINMTLPGDVDPATARLDIYCATTVPGALAGAVAELTPSSGAGSRGRIDEVAARLAAGATLRALYRSQGLDPDDLPADLAANSQLDLQYLYSAQGADGGWGPWPGTTSELPATLAVLEALQQLGAEPDSTLDAQTIARGVAWVQQAASVPVIPGAAVDPALDPAVADATARAIYLLARYNSADPTSVNRLLAAEPRLSLRSRAYLALTLAQIGRTEEARLIVARLAAAAGSSADPIVLDALLIADPTGARGPVVEIARALLGARVGATWATPDETAAAVRALSHYAAVVPETATAGSYRILVNGQLVREVAAGPAAPDGGRTRLTVSGARLHSGTNTVRLETSGARLYYSLRVQAPLAADEHPIATRQSDSAPLGLLRVYEPLAPSAVHVALTMTVGIPMGPMRLDDPLPAGLTRLPGLRFVRLDGPPDAPIAVDLAGAIQAVDHMPEGRGLRVWFGPLPAGKYALSYDAATIALGSYTALPALLQTQDDLDIWVRSGSDSLLLDH
jgi:hypothetical protein